MVEVHIPHLASNKQLHWCLAVLSSQRSMRKGKNEFVQAVLYARDVDVMQYSNIQITVPVQDANLLHKGEELIEQGYATNPELPPQSFNPAILNSKTVQANCYNIN